VLSKIADMRPLLHRAESTARSFAITGDQEFATEYQHTTAALMPALDRLIATVHDSPGERRLIQETKALVERQIAFNGELIRLRNAGDDAGIVALVSREDRAATAAITDNLDMAVTEARRLLGARRAGVDQKVIDVIKYDRPVTGLAEKEATAIEFGRAMLRGNRQVPPELFAKMVALFGRRGTMEITMVMGDYAMTAMVLNAVDQHLPPDREPLLPPLR